MFINPTIQKILAEFIAKMPEDATELEIPQDTNIVLSGMTIFKNKEPDFFMFEFTDEATGDKYYVG
jgi:hypothetical protein